jgi:hypothetical protein
MHVPTSRVAFLVLVAGCRLGEHVAAPPIDADPGAADAADDDAPPPDAPLPGGLHAMIGERPEWSGHCSALDDRAELEDRFDPVVREMVVTAGWEFDTDADRYDDPSYGFVPPWPGAEPGRFSLRFRGRLQLAPGPHCLSIDIGATGTDIIGGKNACGQIWIGAANAPLAETGYGAPSLAAAVGCVDGAGGLTDLDVVFWYFNVLERARLRVRWCPGAGCVPDRPLTTDLVWPR